MIEIVVRGDRVVTQTGVQACDLAIESGRIVAVSAAGSLPVPEGATLIDATGKIVIPGGIDPHVHCKWHLPGPDGTATETAAPRRRQQGGGAWRNDHDD